MAKLKNTNSYKRFKIPKFDNGLYALLTEPMSDDWFENNQAFRVDPNTGYAKVLDKNGNVLTENGVVQLPEINITGVSPQTKWQRAEDIYRSQTMREYEQGTKDARNILEALAFPFATGEGAADLVTSLSKDMFTKEALKYGGKMLWDNKWNIAKNFIKGGVKGEIASTVGNTALNYATGYTAPQLISEATGLPEGVAEWMDPFFLYGAGAKWPGEKGFSSWLKNKFPNSSNLTMLSKNITTPEDISVARSFNGSYKHRISQLSSKMEKEGLSIDDLVDKDGNIIDENLAPVLKILSERFKQGGSLGKGEVHPRSRQTTLEHLYATAKSAQQLKQPKGITKLQLVFEALTHDIGEFISREDHPAHSKEILLELFPNIGKLVLDDVSAHMSTAYGTESQKALHAADVITGGNVEQMLNKYPLINYGQYVRNTNIGRPDIKNLPTSEQISRVNEWLKMRGLPQMDTSLPQETAMQLLRDTMRRYRTVVRGVKLNGDIDKFSERGGIGEYASNFIKNEISKGKSKEEAVDEFFKYITTNTPEIDTRYGKLGLFDFLKKNGFSEYTKEGISDGGEVSNTPGKIQLRKKESRLIKDADSAIYTSNSDDVAAGYASGGIYGDGYYAEIPEQYDPSMTMIDYVLANDFPLYNTEGALNPKYDFKVPYTLLTSKSEREVIGKNLSKKASIDFSKASDEGNITDIISRYASDDVLNREFVEYMKRTYPGSLRYDVNEYNNFLYEQQRLQDQMKLFRTLDESKGELRTKFDFNKGDMIFDYDLYNNYVRAAKQLDRITSFLEDGVPGTVGKEKRMLRHISDAVDILESYAKVFSSEKIGYKQSQTTSTRYNQAMKIVENLRSITDEIQHTSFIDRFEDGNVTINPKTRDNFVKKINDVKSDIQTYYKHRLTEMNEQLQLSMNGFNMSSEQFNVLRKITDAFPDSRYDINTGDLKFSLGNKPNEAFKAIGKFRNSKTCSKDDIINIYKNINGGIISEKDVESIKNLSDGVVKKFGEQMYDFYHATYDAYLSKISKDPSYEYITKGGDGRKIYPMHLTVEANRHPVAFTTEEFNEPDGHQHYVFTGRPGLKILVNPRRAHLDIKTKRNTSHSGKQSPNTSTKLFSITAPIIGVGAAVKQKKNENK